MSLSLPCCTIKFILASLLFCPVYPYNVWSFGVPNKPTFQLLGCFHFVIRESSFKILATMPAKSSASARLSPSSTNWRTQAVGMDHEGGSEESSRRVMPPPGMKGTSDCGCELGTGLAALPPRPSRCAGANEYVGRPFTCEIFDCGMFVETELCVGISLYTGDLKRRSDAFHYLKPSR